MTEPTQPHFHRITALSDPYATPAAPDAATELADAELLAEVQALTAQVSVLAPQVGKLVPDVTKLQKTDKRNWSWLKSGIGFMAFDIIVTLFGVIFGFSVYRIAHQTEITAQQNTQLIQQVAANQARLDTTVHEFCSLYGSFIGFYSTKARDAFIGGPDQYNALYRQLVTSSNDLQCHITLPPGLGG
jgi:hypothetical protein